MVFYTIVITMFSFADKSDTTKDSELIEGFSDSDQQTIESVDAATFAQYVTSEKPILIDVRTEAEFTGERLEGAINIDYFDPLFHTRLRELDKHKKYAIYCRSGGRSVQTLLIMKEMMFRRVFDLQGGIIAWTREGLPTSR